MLVGYERVSSEDQILDLQHDALVKAGCDRIFSEKLSGVKAIRPELAAALAYLRPGDTLVVWRLDRLGRSLKDLLIIIEDLSARGIGFKSLTENIDTTSSSGKLVFSIFGAIAEFERQLIRERTLAGLAAARARGRKSGRKIQHDDKKIAAVQHLAASSENSISQSCQTIGISRATYYRRSKLIES
jgi:DNA invertase Pin-like site-specific DNA recombinase